MVRPQPSANRPTPESDYQQELEALKVKVYRILIGGALALVGSEAVLYHQSLPHESPSAVAIGPIIKPMRKKIITRPAAKTLPPAWAIAGPTPELMTNGDYSSCNLGTLDGYGNYEKPKSYETGPLTDYRILFPRDNPIQDGKYDVWFQFHSNEPFWKEWTKVMERTVLVTLKLTGRSGVYSGQFTTPSDWYMLRNTISEAVAQHYGQKSAKAGRIGLSGFSAGCGALQKISDFSQNIDSMICLDGIHATYQDTQHHSVTDRRQFKSASDLPTAFPDFSRMAADGRKFLGITHSSVPHSILPGKDDKPDIFFSSTTATASKMIWWVGGSEPARIPDQPKGPYDAYRRYDQGDFHVIGSEEETDRPMPVNYSSLQNCWQRLKKPVVFNKKPHA